MELLRRSGSRADGGFGLVIGIEGTAGGGELARSGADVVIADLADIVRTGDRRVSELPNALASYGQLMQSSGITSARESMVFLDYHGTLLAIVSYHTVTCRRRRQALERSRRHVRWLS